MTEVLRAWGRTALSSSVRPTEQFYWPRLTREAVMTNAVNEATGQRLAGARGGSLSG